MGFMGIKGQMMSESKKEKPLLSHKALKCHSVVEVVKDMGRGSQWVGGKPTKDSGVSLEAK